MIRFIKLAVISFVVFFCLITAIGLLFSPVVTVVRQATIQAPSEKLYPLIADTKNWHLWLADTTVKVLQVSSNTTGKGATVTINGKKVYITEVTPDYIESVWVLREGRVQTSGFYLKKDEQTGGTIVQIHFSQKLPWYPWERIAAKLNEKILGPVLETNLERLKQAVE